MLKEKISNCYSSQGYEVIHQPHIHNLSLITGLDAYSPDLIVKIGDDQSLFITIADHATNLPIANYCKIARAIAKQKGWRFLLITGDDATPIAEEDVADLTLTRPQILRRKERIAKLISIGEHEAAFLSLWIFAEVLMRRHARQALLPIDRLATILMIHYLHEQAEISEDQFARVIALNEIRNRVAHGFPVKANNLNSAIEKLLNLVDEFIATEKH